MFGIGETELVLILLFAFMIFGPDKLPGMGKTLGHALRQFRNAQEGFTQVVQTEIVDPATEAMSDGPKKKPNRNRVEFDEDADIEGGEGSEAAPRRTETFAERKARLAAERKAAEEAEKAKEAEKDAAGSADTDADADAPVAGDAPQAPETEAAPAPSEPEAPKKPSVADLYTMKRPAAATADDASDEDVDADAPAAPAGDDAPAAQKED